MSTNENETVTGQTNETDYFEVIDGVISLNADYRGDGDEQQMQFAGNGDKLPLPDVLVIPKQIGNDVVTSLAEGMFYNNKRVKEIVLPDGITEIPAYFCAKATNLRAVKGTENITKIGERAFGFTRIKEALFPSLGTLGQSAFSNCGYLEIADIGSVSAIPQLAFNNCALLREVYQTGNEVSIGEGAFKNTRCLRDLPLLDRANQVDNGAFFGSGIRTDLQPGGLIGAKAFPAFDNKTDFWTGVETIPCRNRIVTKHCQSNATWKNGVFLLDEPARTYFSYEKACALFAVMHIHSAITGTYYSHPEQFVGELKQNGLSYFLYYDNWPGQFHNVVPMFEAMGYRTKVYNRLSKANYKILVDALAQGAYIYTQVSEYGTWINGNNPDAGHAVVIYGINNLGEVCVLDSAVVHEPFRKDGFETGTDVYTYTIPLQNLVGPSSNFVIVYPTRFTVDSLPSNLHTGVNVLKTSTSAELGQEFGEEGSLMAYHLFSDPAKAVEEWQSDDGTRKAVRWAKNAGEWSVWAECASAQPTTLNDGRNVNVLSVNTDTDFAQLPEGKAGQKTVYHLFSDTAYDIEEWQPNGSGYKYVRYHEIPEIWSDWYVVAPAISVPQVNAE